MKQPIVIRDVKEWMKIRRSLGSKSVGFVPTMGALHLGHASLLQRARKENEIVVLSVYVNPTQFNDPKDLEKYPSTLDQDVAIAANENVDYVLVPTYPQIYPDGYRYKVTENDLSTRLCGAHRPGHFDGVLSVVMKLLNLVKPTKSYFGEKDFQQLDLIRGMVAAFFMETEIVACPTVRESDGLAMSSRNVNLTPEHRRLAASFPAVLKSQPTAEGAKNELTKIGFDVDYVDDVGTRRFGAVKIGAVRLIDNVER